MKRYWVCWLQPATGELPSSMVRFIVDWWVSSATQPDGQQKAFAILDMDGYDPQEMFRFTPRVTPIFIEEKAADFWPPEGQWPRRAQEASVWDYIIKDIDDVRNGKAIFDNGDIRITNYIEALHLLQRARIILLDGGIRELGPQPTRSA